MENKKYKYYVLLVPLALTVVVTAFYCLTRITLFLISDFPLSNKLFALMLILGEIFIIIHGFGYIMNIIYILRQNKSLTEPLTLLQPKTFPPIAVVVVSYKEPIKIIRETLVCFYNLTYPNKHLYFLDDTRYNQPWDTPENIQAYRISLDKLCEELEMNIFRRQWHGAKAGLINDFIDFLYGENKEGFQFLKFEQRKKEEREKYIIIFDADMNPFPNFAEPLVAKMENNSKLAFIQTPQYYTNFDTNRVARASGLMQAVFFEFICEAKGKNDSMLCCGTNVIFRLEALREVNGFDESSVTEDFSTTFSLHIKGWKSDYLNLISAFGLGPEDLGAFFKQQFRWAYGTITMFKRIVKTFLKRPNQFSYDVWAQYILSSTYYFIGAVFFIMLICPLVFIFFNFPTYFANSVIYLVSFVPYIVLSNLIFYWTLSFKKYRFKDLLLGVILISISFPVYMRAAILSLLNVKIKFGVTPKGGSSSLPLSSLWVQLTAALLSLAAVVYGSFRLYFESDMFFSILINLIWSFYYFVFLSFTLYFNHPIEEEEIKEFATSIQP